MGSANKEVIDQLRNSGIARGLVEDVVPLPLYGALVAEARAAMASRYAKLQAEAESKDRTHAKRFLRQWLGRYPIYDPTSVWARVARELEPIATAYLESPAILRFYNLWETVPTSGPPSRSQLWHKDHEDTRICKAFLYLSDVTEEAGPLVYAMYTHAGGKYAGREPGTFCEVDSGWVRSTDEQVAAICPQEEWTVATGPKGTLVIADTAGYHKGGHGSVTRLLATWEWTTDRYNDVPRFHQLGPQP